jgi:hypothetical protein
VFEKGSAFVRRVYEGVGSIIDLTPEMEEVYEQLFFASDNDRTVKENVNTPEPEGEPTANNLETEDERVYYQTNIGQMMFDFTEEAPEREAIGKAEETPKTAGLDERLKTFAGNKAFGVSKRTTLFDYAATANDTPAYHLHMRGEKESLEITKEGYEYLRTAYQKAEKQKSLAAESTEEQKALFQQMIEESRNQNEKPEEQDQAENAGETGNREETPGGELPENGMKPGMNRKNRRSEKNYPERNLLKTKITPVKIPEMKKKMKPE